MSEEKSVGKQNSIMWLVIRLSYYAYVIAVSVYLYRVGAAEPGGIKPFIEEGMRSEYLLIYIVMLVAIAQKFGSNIEKYIIVSPFYFLVLHPVAAIALILLKYIMTTRSVVHIIAVGVYTFYVLTSSSGTLMADLHENSLYKLGGIIAVVTLIELFRPNGILVNMNKKRLAKRDTVRIEKSKREYIERQEAEKRKKQEEIDAYNKKYIEENREKPDIDSGIF